MRMRSLARTTFSYETITLFRDGEFILALGNISVSIVLCLVAVWLGYELGFRR
jgi:fluoride exporter